MWMVLVAVFIFTTTVLFMKRRKRSQDSGGGDSSLLPFSAMPGPVSFPLVGCLPHYWSGRYSLDRLHWNGLAKYRQYGDIVREDIVPGVSLVWLFNPEDIKKLFLAEVSCPSRRSHTAVEFFRKQRTHI